jgi:integrase
MAYRIDQKGARDKLAIRREPYWTKLAGGRYLGFRKTDKEPETCGTWIARVRDDTGKQHYHSLGQLTAAFDYDEAKRAAEAWFERRTLPGVDDTHAEDFGPLETVADACRFYVAKLKSAGRAATAQDHRRRFERTVYGREKASRARALKAFPIAAVRLERFHMSHGEAWRDALAKAQTESAVNRNLIALRASLNMAADNRRDLPHLRNEVRLVKAYKAAGGRRTIYLDRDQRRRLRDVCDGGLLDLVEAAALTGCRPGELRSLTRGAFDARTGMIRVTGKTGTRTIPLSADAIALFKRLARNKLPSAALLTRDDGKPWAHSDYDELVRDAVKRADLPAGTVLYSLRHSWITESLMGGLSTLEAAKITGTSLPMIEKHYGHLALSAARERLDAVKML